ncbi:MAG TPA: NAD-dependent epimerase/dehydratase family protein [Acidimicrobiales bacterium]
MTGATGNVGSSVLDALCGEPEVDSVVGLARRIPDTVPERWAAKVQFAKADVVTDDLAPHFAGADAVVHLAWLIQPSHKLDVLHATNVDGSARVFQAVADASVPNLVYASSVGAYSPGPKDRPVDESWPTDGIPSSFYARHKAAVERQLDQFEATYPGVRVARLRPGLIFKREAASSIQRLFLGRLLPVRALRPRFIPAVPRIDRLVFQAVHTEDIADAYRRALLSDLRGAFNVAADPVLDPAELGRILGAKPLPLPAPVLRVGADVTWKLHLQPTPSGWLDMGLSVPVMDTTRARTELGWAPRHTAAEALLDLLDGFAHRAEGPTPALQRYSKPPKQEEAAEAAATRSAA